MENTLKPIEKEETVHRSSEYVFKMPKVHSLPKFGKASKKEIERQLAEYESLLSAQRTQVQKSSDIDAVKLVRAAA